MAVTLELRPGASRALDPLDALAALAGSNRGDLFLLHSGPAQGYSVLAFDPLYRLIVDADARPHLLSAAVGPPLPAPPAPPLPPDASPLESLQAAVDAFSFDRAPPPLLGWLGFIGYDIAHTLEPVPRIAPDQLRWPLLAFTLFQNYLLFDKSSGQCSAYTVGAAGSRAPADPFAALRTVTRYTPEPPEVPAALVEQQSPAQYRAKIARVRDYIAAGDIYQANLAQRWTVRIPSGSQPPHEIFRRLCQASPAPYASFARFNDGTLRHILSASPELFLTVAGGHAMTRPIKGTRPRDPADPVRDARLRDELLDSAKDRAELAMIVDLLRNDLGRVSRYGSVRVSEPRALEQHPTVWHTAATVESDLRPDATLAELLAAVCPGGSITGAPKIRAMQILEELEGFRRALYCGNIGIISPRLAGAPATGVPNLALNIAIRTILQQDDRAYLYAGGGIVADSDPQLEYEETLHKAAALFRALGLPPPS